MKRPYSGRWAGVFCCALLVWSAPGLLAQSSGEEDSTGPKRFSFGLRLRAFPLPSAGVMDETRGMATFTSSGAVTDRHSTVTSDSAYLGGGPVFEFGLGRKTTIRAEVLYTRLGYENVVDLFSGTDDPSTGHDERSHATSTESTRARLWDFPVMLHYRGFRDSGMLSRMFLAGGVALRNVSRIRTDTKITEADSTTSSNSFAARPDNRNLLGGVVGLGFRFIDDVRINVTPEVRFTRWTGGTFLGSPKNQLEFGIGITY